MSPLFLHRPLAALILFWASLASAQPAGSGQPLQPILDKVAGTLGAGGIVAAEVNDGSVRYLTAGKPAPDDAITPETIVFEIGSISKVFTALILAHAVNEGVCSLDDPIGKFLPPAIAMTPETAAITLAQLATHTSGLPRLPTNFSPANPSDPYSDYTVDRLYDFLRDFKSTGIASKSADYSNLGFGLLGHVLELAYGRSYADVLAEKITTPLGMTDTTINLSTEQQARFATPFSGSERVSPWSFSALPGAGAIRSTATDMAKFAMALLAADQGPLAAAWKLVREPRVEAGSTQAHIGLGIFIGKRNGTSFYTHGGGTGGFRTHLELMPQEKRALVILINNDSVDPAGIAASLNNPLHSATSTPDTVPIAAEALSEYAGVFAVDARMRFTTIVDESGQLRIRLTGQPFLPAFHAGEDRFFLKVVPAQFQFGRNTEGAIASLTLFQNGQEVPAKKTEAAAPKIFFPTAEKLAAYVGRYQLAPGAVFDITLRGTTLLAKLTGQPAFPVHNDRSDHFVYDVVEAALTFERDDSGTVTAVVLHQNGADRRALKVP